MSFQHEPTILDPETGNEELIKAWAAELALLRMGYRGASLIINRLPLGPHRRDMPRVLGGS